MKWQTARKTLLEASAALALLICGCGGSSSPNVVTVTVTPVAVSVIAGQVENFTATVGGSTTLTVQWTCTYVYTPLPTTQTPNPTPTKAAPCTSGQTVNGGSVGTWTITNANSSNVLTYTAPSLSSFPNPIPIVTFIATADADKKKTGTATVGLDSGIRVSITPSTATVPVGISPAQTQSFSAAFQNVNSSTAKYALVQPNTASTNVLDQTANPLSETCDPTCGTIDNNGVFTAPSTLPTDTKPAGSKSTSPTTVFVVAWSSSDTSHFNGATITLVSASTNPVTFKGVYPSTIPAGGLLQDVFLDAKNLLNTTNVYFIPPTPAAQLNAGLLTSNALLNNTTQVFTIPISSAYCTPSTSGTSGATTTVTCDASIVTRVRLQSAQISQAEPDPSQPAWIAVTLPTASATPSGNCVLVANTTSTIACPIDVVNVSPAMVSSVPQNIPQNSSLGTITLGAIGGYYGATGNLVKMSFADQLAIRSSSGVNSRQIFSTIDNSQLPASPGLYEVAVQSTLASGKPPIFPTVITNSAVQPAFPLAPVVQPAIPLNSYVPPGGSAITNLAPSAMALNSVAGYAVIVEQATATLQMVDLAGSVPALVGNPIPMGGTAASPTDIAIDTQLQVNGGDLGIVVSSGDARLYFYSINGKTATPVQPVSSLAVDLATLTGQPGATGLAVPVSFGVDPSTHLGVIAYAGTNSVSTSVGFIVDVNPNLDSSDTHTCFLAGQKPPCVIAPVSFNTGPSPKVVMQPNVPLAYVTPGGGGGVTSVVNLLQQGTTVSILPFSSTTQQSGAFRSANRTTIHTQTPHGINPILGGTVIISGIQSTNDPADSFNGTFNVIPGSVTDPYTFQYVNPGKDDQEKNTASSLGTVTYGSPYYAFSTSTFASAAAINPITRTFAYADFNSSSTQIGLISTLDQTLTTLSLSAGSCGPAPGGTTCQPNPAGAPELGFRSVAFDPFTDILIAFNPTNNSDTNLAGNEISLINPGGPAPGGTTNFPYRIIAAINTGQVGQGSYTPQGASAPVTVFGPMVYDPKSRFVLVANAGSNSLSYMKLDADLSHPFQSVHIQDLRLADNAPAYGVPVGQPALGTLAPAKTCTLTDPKQPCMPQAVRAGQAAKLRILGQGFSAGTPVVRLDAQTGIIPPGQTQSVSVIVTNVTDSEIDATVPAALLFSPHDYALDVQVAGVTSNAIDLHVVGLLDMTPTCAPTASFPQGPEGVAVDDTRHVALVTNYACNTVSVVSIDPTGTVGPYGTVLGSVTVGKQPIGIAVIPRLGVSGTGTGALAAVANSGETPNGTAMIIDYSTPTNPQLVSWTPSGTSTSSNTVTVGLSPLGVAIDQDRGLVLVANSGSNTLSIIDLTVLLPSDSGSTTGHVKGAPTATTVALSGPPTAVAVDPNRDLAVVTNLQNSGTTSVTGGLDVVTLSGTPVKSSTASVSSLSASLTGLVYDPGDPNGASSTATGVFYATSTQQNAIYSFNPSSTATQTIKVGINPYSLGFNFQTGTLLTINSTSNTASVVDTQNFKTRQTLGITSLSQFAIDVDKLTNTSVIVDQNNNRVVFLAMPK
jgi:DNA-binding beta-propeller fold protein YncE